MAQRQSVKIESLSEKQEQGGVKNEKTNEMIEQENEGRIEFERSMELPSLEKLQISLAQDNKTIKEVCAHIEEIARSKHEISVGARPDEQPLKSPEDFQKAVYERDEALHQFEAFYSAAQKQLEHLQSLGINKSSDLKNVESILRSYQELTIKAYEFWSVAYRIYEHIKECDQNRAVEALPPKFYPKSWADQVENDAIQQTIEKLQQEIDAAIPKIGPFAVPVFLQKRTEEDADREQRLKQVVMYEKIHALVAQQPAIPSIPHLETVMNTAVDSAFNKIGIFLQERHKELLRLSEFVHEKYMYDSDNIQLLVRLYKAFLDIENNSVYETGIESFDAYAPDYYDYNFPQTQKIHRSFTDSSQINLHKRQSQGILETTKAEDVIYASNNERTRAIFGDAACSEITEKYKKMTIDKLYNSVLGNREVAVNVRRTLPFRDTKTTDFYTIFLLLQSDKTFSDQDELELVQKVRDFLSSLSEEEKQTLDPQLIAVLDALLNNGDIPRRIENPQLVQFKDEVRKDPQFIIEYIAHGKYLSVKGIDITDKASGWLDEKSGVYFSPKERLQEIYGEDFDTLKFPINKNDPAFNQFLIIPSEKRLSELEVRPAIDEEEDFQQDTNAYSSKDFLNISWERLKYYLAKHGYSEDLFNRKTISNPEFEKVSLQLVSYAASRIKDEDSNHIPYWLSVIKELDAPFDSAVFQTLLSVADKGKGVQITNIFVERIDLGDTATLSVDDVAALFLTIDRLPGMEDNYHKYFFKFFKELQKDYEKKYATLFGKPIEEVVQDFYIQLILEKNFHAINTCYKQCEIPLSLQSLEQALCAYSSTDYLDRLSDVRDTLGKMGISKFKPEWEKALVKIQGMQPRTNNAEHDPWLHELNPLVAHARQEHGLDLSKKHDAEIIVSFIREYGMYNFPTLLRWHVAIERVQHLDDLPSDVRSEIEDTLGLSFSKLKNKKEIYTAIQECKKQIQSELLNDRLPEKLLTPLGHEIFSSLRGTSSWERGDNFDALARQWLATVSNYPSVAELPEHYTKISLEVPCLASRKLDEKEEDRYERKKKEILENAALETWIENFEHAFRSAIDSTSISAWWHETQQKLLSEIDDELTRLSSTEAKNEKAAIGLSKKRETLEKQRKSIVDIAAPEQQATDMVLVQFLEVLAQALPDKYQEKDALLRTVSAYHMLALLDEQGTGRKEDIRQLLAQTSPDKEQSLEKWNALLIEYMREHYFFDPAGAMFKEKTLQSITSLWDGILPEDRKQLFSQAEQMPDLAHWWVGVEEDLLSRTGTTEEQEMLKERLVRIGEPLSKKKNIERALLNFMENLFKDLPYVINGAELDRDAILRQATAQHALRSLQGVQDEENMISGYVQRFSSEGVVVHTGHELFPANTLKTLQRSWGTHMEADQHPLTQAVTALQKLERSLLEDSEEKIPITLVPARGILRIFSGDIGDACYTRLHSELAKGEYERLTSFTYVVGRGEAHERLRGSVLVIETQTPQGEPVLLIRANNPHESLLREVNSEKLLKTTLASLVELAGKRGIKKVVVPLDQSSASCSNRPLVAQYYSGNFSAKQKLELISEPETNFNGYAVWDKGGSHGVVDICS